MNEFELIAQLTRELPTNAAVHTGPGDDCAVLDLDVPGQQLLFKTDAVVEGIHFEKTTAPERIGRKALARSLSDIAAMAGTPVAAVITLGLPENFQPDSIIQIYAGLNQLARQYGVAIVGGETTTNPGRLLISVALLGRVATGKAVLRTGAQAGDALFVTGELGGSRAGKHLDFTPRLTEARWLADHFPLHAMMDLSDGLAGDLPHLLRASRVGAELLKSAVPISRAARDRARRGDAARSAFAAALTDGEDFELLFTLPSHEAVPLLDAWKTRFPELKLSCIGKIVPGAGLRLRDATGVHPITAHGYVHFS
ncbi:MAG TPA: thiamine-phosphate kinase [Verrucomicrobiota bacterium]|nr:thiamine-phosphate kinase [Verrucomicrobiota bacterium]HNT13425.1 thiamine-phosphate kinase [Verrucomicrobiota bacterium]